MKTKYGLILAMILSGSVMAQPTAPNQPPSATVSTAAPVSTNAPAAPTTASVAKPAHKKSAANTAKKKAAAEKKAADVEKAAAAEKDTPPMSAGPAIVRLNHVNVRGRAGLNGEVLARLTKGENVTVLEEVTLKKPKKDEPARWARIAFPAGVRVWVRSSFVDATNKTVLPAKLNLRGGPGENYSVVGLLQRGETVKELSVKNEWLEIEAPATAYAFVASELLTPKEVTVAAAAPSVSVPTAQPAPETAKVETAPAVAPVVEAPATAQPAAPAPAVATPPTVPLPAPEKEDGPPPKRIVEREGIVRGTVSIQAPTHFKLVSPDNGQTINYLYSSTTNLVLRRYNGLRIIVTGEEGLDERWTNTPIITIQKIQVME